MLKKTLCALGYVLLVLTLIVGGYIGYAELNYYRIDDNFILQIENNKTDILNTGTEYTALIHNIGFGAYDTDYSFFMDVGFMKDGTKVTGKHSRGRSEKNVLENVNGMIKNAQKYNADFYMFQEVDEKATRSYGVNQKDMIISAFPEYSNTFAHNMHTPYILLPITEPHGKTDAGLLTLSKYKVESAIRRSYPVGTDFPERHSELDRCFVVSHIPVNNGKELVLINSHLSAYDKGGIFREQQLILLNQVMLDEYKKGNYVIVGGDFNHAMFGTETIFESEQRYPEWINILNESDISSEIEIVKPINYNSVATCRGADIPYKKGVTFVCTVDGFLVSKNITAVTENIDMNFKYSDHNPVLLKFTLK